MPENHQDLDRIRDEPLPEGTSDKSSLEEVGELFKNQKKKNQHYIYLCALWLIFGMVVVGTLILFWHYFAPAKYRWLDQSEVNYISTILVSAVISALLALFLEKKIKQIK